METVDPEQSHKLFLFDVSSVSSGSLHRHAVDAQLTSGLVLLHNLTQLCPTLKTNIRDKSEHLPQLTAASTSCVFSCFTRVVCNHKNSDIPSLTMMARLAPFAHNGLIQRSLNTLAGANTTRCRVHPPAPLQPSSTSVCHFYPGGRHFFPTTPEGGIRETTGGGAHTHAQGNLCL